jgi:hypothetical protein
MVLKVKKLNQIYEKKTASSHLRSSDYRLQQI